MSHQPVEKIGLSRREFSFAPDTLLNGQKTPSGFYKYDVSLPFAIQNELPLESVNLTVWSREQFKPIKSRDGFIDIINDRQNLPILLCSGLAANSTQYDRTGVSFIKSLDESIQNNLNEQSPKQSLFIAMSCPGFTGSTDMKTDKPVTRDMVSVNTYSDLIAQVIAELKVPNTSILAGHSAGGAAVLNLLSENKADARAYIALHPAIHKKRALQFDQMRFLEQIKPVLLNDELKRFATQIVIRYYLGLNIINGYPVADQLKAAQFITTLKNGLHGLSVLTPAELEQVYLHVNEFMSHPSAVQAKLDDLRNARSHGELTAAAATFVISGNKDRITRDQDINDEFRTIITHRATHKIMDTNHDDMFIKPDAQQTATELIACNALFDLHLANAQVTEKIKSQRRDAELERRHQVDIALERRKRS